jgi:hypothetical protein
MPAPKGHKQYGGFVKGFDPHRNMNGRPKKGASLAERVREAMQEVVREEDGYTKMDALIDEALARAKAGNFQFWDALMARGYGKVPDKVEMSTEEKPDLSKLTDEELAQYAALMKKALSK